jgi:siderophore synthetase component
MTTVTTVADPTQTPLTGGRAGGATPHDQERGANPPLLPTLLEALLREDAMGLRTGANLVRRPDLDDGAWLHLPTPDGTGLLVPVVPGALLADFGVRGDPVRRADNMAQLTDVDAVLELLAPADDAEADSGVTALRRECGDALAAEDLAAQARPALVKRLGTAVTAPGLRGALALDALAAARRHPLYPTSAARTGLTSADLAGHAPETAPRFALHWAALPLNVLTQAGSLPAHWPKCADLGLDPSYDDTHLALPVHPLTAAGPLLGALDRAGLASRAVLAPRALVDVVPTLSMRTVAVAERPDLHIKLPLATSTLGRLNRRTLSPGSLADGAAMQRLLEELVAADPALVGRLLHADESTFMHAGSDLLGALVRRWPTGLAHARVIPVAALSACLGDGRTVAQQVADVFFGGDLTAFMEAYLRLLVDVHVRLWLVHGVALEAHQQNTALVIDEVAGMPRLRLLLKDNDGPRLNREVLAASRGGAPEPVFEDDRLWASEPRELCDVVTTIALHLCAASVVVHVTDDGSARRRLFSVMRGELEHAAEEHSGRRDVGLLCTQVLDADRLRIKGMLTAGTLLPKTRTAARDVNKHYAGTAPTYLPHSG